MIQQIILQHCKKETAQYNCFYQNVFKSKLINMVVVILTYKFYLLL
jgi:hypothetical protein